MLYSNIKPTHLSYEMKWFSVTIPLPVHVFVTNVNKNMDIGVVNELAGP